MVEFAKSNHLEGELGSLELRQYQNYRKTTGNPNPLGYEEYTRGYTDVRVQDYVGKQIGSTKSEKEKKQDRQDAWNKKTEEFFGIGEKLKDDIEGEKKKDIAEKKEEIEKKYHPVQVSGKYKLTIYKKGDNYINENNEIVKTAVETYVVTKEGKVIYRGPDYSTAKSKAHIG